MPERLLSDQESQYRKQQYHKYLEEVVAKLETDRESVFVELNKMFDLYDIANEPEEYMSELIDLVPVDYDTWLKVTLEREAFDAYCSGIKPVPTAPSEDDFYSEMDEDQADIMKHIDQHIDEQTGKQKLRGLQVVESDELPY